MLLYKALEVLVVVLKFGVFQGTEVRANLTIVRLNDKYAFEYRVNHLFPKAKGPMDQP